MVIGCKRELRFVGANCFCKGIYREKFLVYSGGAWSAELYKDYLTDSTNFRIYIGEHEERSNFDYQCSGDTITVKKFTWDESHSNNKILSRQVLLVSVLKKENNLKEVDFD